MGAVTAELRKPVLGASIAGGPWLQSRRWQSINCEPERGPLCAAQPLWPCVAHVSCAGDSRIDSPGHLVGDPERRTNKVPVPSTPCEPTRIESATPAAGIRLPGQKACPMPHHRLYMALPVPKRRVLRIHASFTPGEGRLIALRAIHRGSKA
jgi:hypothetical protein